MARPGPKPVDLQHLKTEAQQWANVLFCLRDGQAGMIQKIKWGPWRSVPYTKHSQSMLDLMKGTPWENARLLKTKMRRAKIGTTLVAEIVPANAQSVRKVSKSFKLEKGWEYTPPRLPSPKVWQQLKEAASVTGMQRVLRSIQKYIFRNWSAWPGIPFPYKLDRHAAAILEAKQLFGYPKSHRGRSEDKRIVFFAKVFAGLRLGRSALYTTKRLAHWHPLKDLAINPYKEFVASFSQRGDSK
jgi:hypothetical protein